MTNKNVTDVDSFLKKLNACVKEYKKQSNETYDDVDAAHFFDKGLKKWIEENERQIDLISSMGSLTGFVKFLKHYLLVEEEK